MSKPHIMPMASYNYISVDKQASHIPGIGFGMPSGDYGKEFPDIHDRFFELGLRQRVFFPKKRKNEAYHQINAFLDGKIERRQILGIFRFLPDKDVSGGLRAFQAGAGRRYEIIRNSSVPFIRAEGFNTLPPGAAKRNMKHRPRYLIRITIPRGMRRCWLILGLVAEAGDFDFQSSVMPLPFLRFGLNTAWVNLHFDWKQEFIPRSLIRNIHAPRLTILDLLIGVRASWYNKFPLHRRCLRARSWILHFLAAPSLSLTSAPEKRLRFTADIRMDNYPNIEDILVDCIFWFRSFDRNSASGDPAGIGVSIKKDGLGFDLSTTRDKKHQIQYRAVFEIFDLTVLRIETGYIFDSPAFVDEQKNNSQGKGFFIIVQGMYQF